MNNKKNNLTIPSSAVFSSKIDFPMWESRWTIYKRYGNWSGKQIVREEAPQPYEIIEGKGNLLTYGGASYMWTALTGGSIIGFTNASACIGVGDSTTAASASQTNLQAATNKIRKGMDATYPQHNDGTSSSANATVTFQSSFTSSEANFDWNEWAIFNDIDDAEGRMLNRKVVVLGTKPPGSTWTINVVLSLS